MSYVHPTYGGPRADLAPSAGCPCCQRGEDRPIKDLCDACWARITRMMDCSHPVSDVRLAGMETQPTVKQITDAISDLGEAEARRILGGKTVTQATPRELAELVRAARERRS